MAARPRVALVGPLPPIRGGIAHHTESLRQALDRHADLVAIPYRRIYPGWLFPGESPFEPGADRPLHQHPPDALDPRTWGVAVRAAQERGSERLVMPWWTAAVALPTWSIARSFRRAGVPVTFLCHNVVDHESAEWKRFLTRRVFLQGSKFVVASEAEAARLELIRPGAAVAIHPHPVYQHLPAPGASLPRRSSRELLFFGLIRRYKGLDVLIEALARLPTEDWALTVAGEPWQGTETLKHRVAEAGLSDRVEWIERYVTDSEAAALFSRADAVVLPYRRATGCGVLALALGQEKPVIASDVSGLREQVVDQRTGWLVPPGDPDALARALRDLRSDNAALMKPAIRELAQRWTWDSLARTLIDD